MVDTGFDLDGLPPPLDVPLASHPVSVPATPAEITQVAQQGLQRCLAIGLMAAVHADRMTWADTFRVTAAVANAAWDMFDAEARHALAA
ncbi:hypothetical protein ACFQZ4_11875 [Catellatospora coxensis]